MLVKTVSSCLPIARVKREGCGAATVGSYRASLSAEVGYVKGDGEMKS